MQNYKSLLLGLCVCLGLAACGGGGGGGNSNLPPSGGGGNTQTDAVQTNSSFLSVTNPDGSLTDLFSILYADANITTSSNIRSMQSLNLMAKQVPPKTNTFKPSVAGGNATIALKNNGSIQSVAAITTYRDAAGSCECSNDLVNGQVVPPPYAATITNPNWYGGKAWNALAATDVLSTFMLKDSNKNPVAMPATSGAYTFAINGDPGNTASFTVPHPDQPMARQSVPTIAFNTPSGDNTISWTGAPGAKEYFLAFVTHLGNVSTNPLAVVGYVITPHQYAVIKTSDLYAQTKYQMLLIASTKPFVNSYFSQAQLPLLPDDSSGHLDFSMSQLTSFTTP